MLREKLEAYNIILASGSPRRQQFFKELDIPVEIRLKSIEEIYPKHLKGREISDYLAKLKSYPFLDELKEKDILITSDTIVWANANALGKPKDYAEAFNMISSLSGTSHEVITSVCFSTLKTQKIVSATTVVYFKSLTKEEIDFYINTFKPYDKAGSYGIQEWIGQIAVEKIEGSYFNVMGLPTHLVYKTLINMVT